MTYFKSGNKVRIVKPPGEAPYLKDMVVEVVYARQGKMGGLTVKTPNGFTHLSFSAVELASS